MSFVTGTILPMGDYMGDILAGAEEGARLLGYHLYFTPAYVNLAVLGKGIMPKGVSGDDIRGIISGGIIDEEFQRTVGAAGIPLVLVNHYSHDHPCDCVLCDNYDASSRAVRWLVELGHRRIACIACDLAANVTVQERVRGYRQALSDAGIGGDEELLERVDQFTSKAGQLAMERLAARSAEPTAVFGTCDEVAVGAVQWARSIGLRVPQDLSVLGVNDLPVAEACDPPLTTIRILRREMGRAAAQRLAELARDPEQPPRRIDVLCELVVRDSCAAPARRPASVRSD